MCGGVLGVVDVGRGFPDAPQDVKTTRRDVDIAPYKVHERKSPFGGAAPKTNKKQGQTGKSGSQF